VLAVTGFLSQKFKFILIHNLQYFYSFTYGLFNKAVSISEYAASSNDYLMTLNNKLVRMWKEAALIHLRVQLLPWYMPDGSGQTHEKSVRTVVSQFGFKPGT
jgi:hypothetical protein